MGMARVSDLVICFISKESKSGIFFFRGVKVSQDCLV